MKNVETIEFPRRFMAGRSPSIQGKQTWMRERAEQDSDVLLDNTLTWMARLPKDMRPMVLARRYPRIANHIAGIWRRVARCEDYLDALVVDRRGNRAGFPPEVAQELNTLRGYYAELHPHNNSGWNQIGASA